MTDFSTTNPARLTSYGRGMSRASGATDGRAPVRPAVLGPLPSGVHAERWVNQEQELPAADVVVCHGGSGTLYGALAAGVPVVAVPVFADRFENGRRVTAAGAGLVVKVDGGGSRVCVVDERGAGDRRHHVRRPVRLRSARRSARPITPT